MTGTRTAVVAASAAAVLLLSLFCLVMVLQPWRSCPGVDDSAAGCPVLERDAVLLQLGGVGLVLAGVVLVVALVRRPSAHRV